MIAKVIAWGNTRDEAIDRLASSLRATKVKGISTTIPAVLRVLKHPEFRRGDHHTRWFEQVHMRS